MLIFDHMNDSISTLATLGSVPTLANWDPMMVNILIAIFLMVSITMILLVLIQRPQGGGLSGAFGSGGGGGGGGAGQTAFGTKTGDVLTWATIGIFITFLGFAIVLNFATRPPEPESVQPVLTAPAGTSDGQIGEQTGETLDLSGALDGLIDDAAQEELGEAALDQTDAETAPDDQSPETDLPVVDE